MRAQRESELAIHYFTLTLDNQIAGGHKWDLDLRSPPDPLKMQRGNPTTLIPTQIYDSYHTLGRHSLHKHIFQIKSRNSHRRQLYHSNTPKSLPKHCCRSRNSPMLCHTATNTVTGKLVQPSDLYKDRPNSHSN